MTYEAIDRHAFEVQMQGHPDDWLDSESLVASDRALPSYVDTRETRLVGVGGARRALACPRSGAT